MKNLIKFLFLIFCFTLSLFINIQSAEFFNGLNSKQHTAVIEAQTVDVPELHDLQQASAFVVAANIPNCEISSLSENKDIYINGLVDKFASQNRLLQQVFNSKYYLAYNSNSHNISSYLKNEICARAP